MCLDVLLLPKVQQGSIEYLGVNMDSVNMLLQFMERRLDKVSHWVRRLRASWCSHVKNFVHFCTFRTFFYN